MEKDFLEIAKENLEYNYQECLGCIEISYCGCRLGYIIRNREGEYVAIYNFDYLTAQYVASDNIENVKLMICKSIATVIEIQDRSKICNGEILNNATFRSFYIDDRYYCKSCGSHSHRCDSSTGMCFECGADDWEPEPDKLGDCI